MSRSQGPLQQTLKGGGKRGIDYRQYTEREKEEMSSQGPEEDRLRQFLNQKPSTSAAEDHAVHLAGGEKKGIVTAVTERHEKNEKGYFRRRGKGKEEENWRGLESSF